MLTSFIHLFSQRNLIMLFYSRQTTSFIDATTIKSRPFDEVLMSFDLTSDSTSLPNDNDYFQSKTSHDSYI